MGKFMCVHPVGGNMDMDAATPLAQAGIPFPLEGIYQIAAQPVGEDFRV
jgi:hypothetical protein